MLTLTRYFSAIRLVHVSCVGISGGLFGIRGLLRIAARPAANHPVLRFAAHVNDSVLLVTAILLTLILQQYPFTDAWLTAKILLLVPYILLGTVALRRARTTAGRALAFFAALLTFIVIIGVAVTHRPAGWLIFLHG